MIIWPYMVTTHDHMTIYGYNTCDGGTSLPWYTRTRIRHMPIYEDRATDYTHIWQPDHTICPYMATRSHDMPIYSNPTI